MNSEVFNLNWKEHQINAAEAFKSLHKDSDFTDVTLATCDGRQLKAHKNILSSVSPFFRNILTSNPHQHPLIYLKGVRFEVLQPILSFIYLGSVAIAQHDLEEFLDTAIELQVKVLSEEKTEENKEADETKEKGETTLKDELFAKNENSFSSQFNTSMPLLPVPVSNSGDFRTETSDENVRNYFCTQCDYKTTNVANFGRHMKQHAGVKYPCNRCEYKATQKSNLKRHQLRYHGF